MKEQTTVERGSTDRYSVISDGLPSQLPDVDPTETQEWLDSFDSLLDSSGRARARFVMIGIPLFWVWMLATGVFLWRRTPAQVTG